MKFFIPIIFLSFCVNPLKAQHSTRLIEWSFTVSLPAAPGESVQLGLAGAMGGFHNGAVIVAGGSNFPERMPWQGGKKKFWQDIFVLLKDGKVEANFRWLERTFKLPYPLAYGASAVTAAGILLIGGENEDGILSTVHLLQWNASKKEVSFNVMPPLPLPLTNSSAAVIDDVVFVVGGETTGRASNAVFSLDLASPASWKTQAPLPLALSHAVAVTQSNGDYSCLYIIGGRTRTRSGISDLHASTFRFDPRKNKWDQLNDITDSIGTATSLSAASGLAIGAKSILLFGGDKGDVFKRIQHYNARIESSQNEQVKQELQIEKEQLLITHPGFSKDIYLFNTVTNEWTSIGAMPASHVTTFAVQSGNSILIPSGEIKPGIRTPRILLGNMRRSDTF